MPCWAANTDALPTYWNPIMNRLNAEKFPVAPGSEEYTRVEKAFMLTLDDPSRDLKRTQFTIQSVERIQNMDLWNSYVAKRKSIFGRKSPKDAQSLVRNWLFHGCSGVVTDKIVQQGFNRSFCGKNATMYGKGVYFARDASYSTYPLYSQRDANDVQSIFLARVVVGEYCRGVKDALTPAERDATTHALYDSTVDDPQNPNIFVTYKDGQAYPEYLVKFKQDGNPSSHPTTNKPAHPDYRPDVLFSLEAEAKRRAAAEAERKCQAAEAAKAPANQRRGSGGGDWRCGGCGGGGPSAHQ